MNAHLNRRELLLALVGLGATMAFTTPISQASELQIDEGWRALAKNPWYFEVNVQGTIVEADNVGPQINSDVYQFVSGAHLKVLSH